MDGLPLFGGCGSCGTDLPATAKAVTACAASVSKAGAAFVAGTRTALDKCSAAFVKCAQEKPGDAGCLTKATATCGKVPVGLAKARTKLQGVVRKKCGGALAFATLEQPSGINLDALTCACQQVGVEPVLGIDDYAVCLRASTSAPSRPCCRRSCQSSTPSSRRRASPSAICSASRQRHSPRSMLPPAGARSLHAAVRRHQQVHEERVSGGAEDDEVTRSRPVACRRGSGRRSAESVRRGREDSARSACRSRKKPTLSKNSGSEARRRAAPSLIIAVRRADGEFVADHYELPLEDTSVDSEVQLDVEYADDLASCAFELALSVMEDGEVASYTAIEQQPHVPPTNDSCATAKPLAANPYFELLDATAASTPDGLNPRAPTAGSRGPCGTVSRPTRTASSRISTVGSSYDTLIAVYDRCGGNELACANDAVQDGLQIPVVAGTPYLIESRQQR